MSHLFLNKRARIQGYYSVVESHHSGTTSLSQFIKSTSPGTGSSNNKKIVAFGQKLENDFLCVTVLP